MTRKYCPNCGGAVEGDRCPGCGYPDVNVDPQDIPTSCKSPGRGGCGSCDACLEWGDQEVLRRKEGSG